MNLVVKKSFIFLGFLLLLIGVPLAAQNDFSNLDALLARPQGAISPNVWQSALTSYLSKCKGDCPCVLVVAEGIQGQDTSANMWIGTFKGAGTTELWSGRVSRLANSGQNDISVNMDTNPCKRRNGVANTSSGECCIPGRQCRSCGVYRSIADELGLPNDVELTSFYFSTPMQNETYKFHDFYPCSTLPCPATLGCLGLERHAMKALCLNHMGSDGSNGVNAPERGGAWLYFHNINAPRTSGSREDARAGLERLARGELCGDTSTIHLASGEIMQSGNYSDPGSHSSAQTNSYDSGSSHYESGFDRSSHSSRSQQGTAAAISALPAAIQGIAEVKQLQISEEAALKAQAASEGAPKNQGYCRDSLTASCENRSKAEIDQYCSKPAAYKRVGCTFTYQEGKVQ